MGRYSGIKMTKLTHHIIKNINPNVLMNVNLSQIIAQLSSSTALDRIDPQEYYALAKRLGMDGTVFTTILKENYDRLAQIRDKHGLRSIQLTLDLIMTLIVNECKTDETPLCDKIRQLTGIPKAKKGWL